MNKMRKFWALILSVWGSIVIASNQPEEPTTDETEEHMTESEEQQVQNRLLENRLRSSDRDY